MNVFPTTLVSYPAVTTNRIIYLAIPADSTAQFYRLFFPELRYIGNWALSSMSWRRSSNCSMTC